ncbi:hypothetical protein [Vibrio phage TCU_VP02_YC]|uniref:Uncharacterized protein n=1 Tax=Vibrio phage phi-pp2 TaxID=1204514 RepID=I6WHU0_9CAUD|nr:hypothetical protein pp2_190 [Vibrio phage phi-pp2]UNA01710.1 hypothetical protein [Vibrio phage PC-Liy1]URQ03006.1 hypothetical protein PVA8_20 [Vibrio phage PVA8]WBM58742.1 hypothetical protein vBValMPVA8_20 [Vibrio phage vB_ValM_PVA8]
MKYVRYTEFNDHEGETWHRFIPMTDPCLDKFLDVMKLVEDDPEEAYSIEVDANGKLVQYDESYVKVLVDEAAMYMSGYMNMYAVCNINEKLFEWVADVDNDVEAVCEMLYKMGWAK